jgi:Fe-coproporphyrin III synthase
MIGISKLYLGAVEEADVLRYGGESGRLPSHLLQFSRDKKPVVVFNASVAPSAVFAGQETGGRL